MRSLFGTVEQAFWTMLWIIIMLIIAFAILKFIQDHGDPLGIASWVESHAQPQQG
jgi:hypothetical protein